MFGDATAWSCCENILPDKSLFLSLLDWGRNTRQSLIIRKQVIGDDRRNTDAPDTNLARPAFRLFGFS